MQYRMLHAADIHIYRKILIRLFSAHQFLIIFVVHITKEIPGRTGPLRHGIGLSLGRSAADRTSGVHPPVNIRQRRFTCSGRLIGLHFRKQQRKLILRYRHTAALRTMNNRNRLSPITLTGEYPVTKFVIHRFMADSHLFNHYRSFLLQHGALHAVPFSGIDHGSACFRISLRHIFNFFPIFGDNLDDRNIKFLRKLKVPVVMGGHAHDSSRTVICQYIIRQPDGHLGSV